jgi:pyridoxine/pyridoxamine 5'-phosphate oxidase
MEDKKLKILEYIGKQLLTVIATVDPDTARPESAVIAFAEKNDLKLIFGTSNKTRKYANLTKNKQVSFVIGWDLEQGRTVQYEGIARELADDEALKASEIQMTKNPRSKKYGSDPSQRYFEVTPTWIRYKHAAEEFEITF